MFCINNLSYSFSLYLDKYGSMVMIKFTTLFYLVASYCNFWIDLLHIAWVMSSFTTSYCLCIVIWSYSLNLKISISCTCTCHWKLSLFHCKAIDLISILFAYFFRAQYLASFFSWFSFNKSVYPLIVSYNYICCSIIAFLCFTIISSIYNWFNFFFLGLKYLLDMNFSYTDVML